MKKLYYIVTACAMISLTSCKKQVHRISTNEVKDLSGRFNDTDSQMIAQDIVNQILNECHDLSYNNDEVRVLSVGDVKNFSHEHIDCSTFMNDIERNLINSRKCRIVANRSLREAMMNNMDDYYNEDISSIDTQRKCAQELGINRMIFGSITSIVDKEKSEAVKFYQFDIRLINVNTNEVLWMGTKKIKKYIKN